MSMSDPLNHLGSIRYHSEPSDVPYSQNQLLDWTFFAVSYSKTALVKIQMIVSEYKVANSV